MHPERLKLLSFENNEMPCAHMPNGWLTEILPSLSWAGNARRWEGMKIHEWAMQVMQRGERVRSRDRVTLELCGVDPEVPFLVGEAEQLAAGVVNGQCARTWIFYPGLIVGYDKPRHLHRLEASNIRRFDNRTVIVGEDEGMAHIQVFDRETGLTKWTPYGKYGALVDTDVPVVLAYALKAINRIMTNAFDPTDLDDCAEYQYLLHQKGVYRYRYQEGAVLPPMADSPNYWWCSVLKPQAIADHSKVIRFAASHPLWGRTGVKTVTPISVREYHRKVWGYKDHVFLTLEERATIYAELVEEFHQILRAIQNI